MFRLTHILCLPCICHPVNRIRAQPEQDAPRPRAPAWSRARRLLAMAGMRHGPTASLPAPRCPSAIPEVSFPRRFTHSSARLIKPRGSSSQCATLDNAPPLNRFPPLRRDPIRKLILIIHVSASVLRPAFPKARPCQLSSPRSRLTPSRAVELCGFIYGCATVLTQLT